MKIFCKVLDKVFNQDEASYFQERSAVIQRCIGMPQTNDVAQLLSDLLNHRADPLEFNPDL